MNNTNIEHSIESMFEDSLGNKTDDREVNFGGIKKNLDYDQKQDIIDADFDIINMMTVEFDDKSDDDLN
jgi:hypothetical protein